MRPREHLLRHVRVCGNHVDFGAALAPAPMLSSAVPGYICCTGERVHALTENVFRARVLALRPRAVAAEVRPGPWTLAFPATDTSSNCQAGFKMQALGGFSTTQGSSTSPQAPLLMVETPL